MRISDWSSDVCSSDLLVPLVEALKMPIVPIGVGAQAATYRRIQLPAGTKRFLAAVADRCHSVGVRGHYSAEVLHDAGIKNVSVIGCPSVFRSLQPTQKKIGRASCRERVCQYV